MEKIKGSMEVLSSLQTTVDIEGLDHASKELYKNKEILAVILKDVVREFEAYDTKQIMGFIEADSITDNEEVSPGRTNTRIQGSDKEFVALNEKVALFDTRFKAVNPELSDGKIVVSLHIDLEVQRTYRPGYPIEKRGLYYLARELGAQLTLVTETTDYGVLEKCYSIWICRDAIPREEQFSISFIEMDNTKNYGQCHPEKNNYDLLTLVIIRLGDEHFDAARENPGYDALRLSHAIMYPHKPDFLDTIKQYIDFAENEQLWKEATRMSGLGESILLEGWEKGEAKGIIIGEARGEARGVDLSAEIFKVVVRAGVQDNTIIAEQCGCTAEKVSEIREKFGI